MNGKGLWRDKNVEARTSVPDCGCQPADGEYCVMCCDHAEHDHGFCVDCGWDITDRLIGKAEDAAEGDR